MTSKQKLLQDLFTPEQKLRYYMQQIDDCDQIPALKNLMSNENESESDLTNIELLSDEESSEEEGPEIDINRMYWFNLGPLCG